MAGCEDRGQDVGTAKCRKRRGVHHCDGEQSDSAQVAKHGRVVHRTRLGARCKAGSNFEKRRNSASVGQLELQPAKIVSF